MSQTGALRRWELDSKKLGVEHPDQWQYRLITGILATEKRKGEFDWLPSENLSEADQVAMFLVDAHGERGVFRAIFKSSRKYLCENPVVEAAVADAAKGRFKVDPLTVTVASGFQPAAQAIVDAVSWLDPTMTAVIAGLLLIITAGGLDRYCRRTPPEPVTDVVET
ncbi:hypothetical protein ACFQ6B_28910 [Streptomyces wedmorensis]|uniref:Uncharacterized protein n=1 Tax=Streptomyces wedmorensis TaxID=43759 RepID=A0ABW6IN17_STRWE